MRSFVYLFIFFHSLQIVAQSKPNIIFISIDDLNDFAGGFDGHPQVETPHMRELETKGTIFYNAYCSAPQCGPSRTSFLTGKDVAYTQVYDNSTYKCNDFSQNFTIAKGNQEYFTLPGYLKDSGGYYTYSLNKIFHCYDNFIEYDDVTSDACSKSLSWNKIFYYNDSSEMYPIYFDNDDGLFPLKWGHFDSVYIDQMQDDIVADSAIEFIHNYAIDPSIACDKPFFLGVGFRKPHFPSFSPDNFFLPYYLDDFYGDTYEIPFNYPENSTPFNGVLLNKEAEPRFADMTSLGEVAQNLIGGSDENFTYYKDTLSVVPYILPDLSYAERKLIMEKSHRANLFMAYIANIEFIDTQIGKIISALEEHPEIYNNTIIVFFGDHGFALGEKRRIQKQVLWEEVVRTPLFIADLRSPFAQVSNRMVSLLDMFPTLVELAEIPVPKFYDGSLYLDGQSLVPILKETLPLNERPILSTIKNTINREGACYPHYSIRNNQFHFIHYNPDNAVGIDGCDSTAAPIEEELYEIGMNKEIDPYEFHNLAYDSNYTKLKSYLSAFLPDGDLYLKQPLKVTGKFRGAPACFYNNDDLVKLTVLLEDENGQPLLDTNYTNYSIHWTCQIAKNVVIGKNYNFNLNSISPILFDSLDKIIISIEVFDLSDNLVGFDIIYIYINTFNTPLVTYDTSLEDQTVFFSEYNLIGTYSYTKWDFGDGQFMANELVPGPHTFSMPGSYTIENQVFYGNGCSLNFNKEILIAEIIDKDYAAQNQLNLYPNPAQSDMMLVLKSPIQNAEIFVSNQIGKKVKYIYSEEINDYLQINISDLPTGIYFLEIKSGEFHANKTFEILK